MPLVYVWCPREHADKVSAEVATATARTVKVEWTPEEAAKDCAERLRAMGAREAVAWSPERVTAGGWGSPAWAVALEGWQLAEMQLYKRGPFVAGEQPWPGVLAEPYSSWLLKFHAEVD